MARHPQDYELFEKHAEECISKPDVLLKDAKNANTALFIRHIGTMNINAVVKLSIDERVNTLLTFYRIRESNLKKMMKKNKVLYEKHET